MRPKMNVSVSVSNSKSWSRPSLIQFIKLQTSLSICIFRICHPLRTFFMVTQWCELKGCKTESHNSPFLRVSPKSPNATQLLYNIKNPTSAFTVQPSNCAFHITEVKHKTLPQMTFRLRNESHEPLSTSCCKKTI